MADFLDARFHSTLMLAVLRAVAQGHVWGAQLKSWEGLRTKLTHLQTGQVPLALSQGVMHGSWKTCWHGSVTTISSSGFSALRENCSLHIAQSFSKVSAAESQ
jgi:hypothetical protein